MGAGKSRGLPQSLNSLNVPHRLCCTVGSFPYQVWDLDLALALQKDSEQQRLSTSDCQLACQAWTFICNQDCQDMFCNACCLQRP